MRLDLAIYAVVGAVIGIVTDYALQAIAAGPDGFSSLWFRLRHDTTDFIDGALIGAAIAVTLALLHRRSNSSAP